MNKSMKQPDPVLLTMNRRRFAGFCASIGLGATLLPEALTTAAQNAEEITPEIVAAAEKVAGLTFSESERKSLAKRLNGLLKTYEYMRTIELDNSVSPATVFNPVLPGMEFSTERKPFRINSVSVSMPSSIEDIAFYPVIHLAKLLETRQVTSTDLTKMYLRRLKKYDPVLHCVVTFTEDLALRQARIADEEVAAGKYRGILHGIPWGVKDLFARKGYPTTWGAEPYRNRIIDTDATVITRLTEAGAVLLAKLTTGRFAGGAKWFGGQTKNPWNTEESSSGSSAGPGAATSAGLVGFAIGSETRGSIAGPCERCGVTGLRPTFGRVSRYGAMTLCWSMDKVGPICRTAEDCAVVFNAIIGPDGHDNAVVDIPFNWNPSLDVRTLRVGYVKAEFEGKLESIGDRARLNKKFNNDALDVLRSLGIKLVPIELPNLSNDVSDIILTVEAMAALDYLNAGMKELVDDSGKEIKKFPAQRFVPAVEYLQANRARTLAMKEMAEMFSTINMYVTPTFVGPTNWLTNITGHPELVLPHGFNSKGTPVSISIVGGLYRESEILALGRAYQNATDFHLKHPSL